MDNKSSQIISKALEKVKSSDTFDDLCDKYSIEDREEIDLIPICFKKDLSVSARTEHGCIYLNSKLHDNQESIPMYLIHEIGHWMQQTYGDGPTQGSTDDDYLDNPYEKEGFNIQTEFISETEGDDKAKMYVDRILDYHEVPRKERAERKKELLTLAGLGKTKEELRAEYDAAMEAGPRESHARPTITRKLPEKYKTQLIENLKELDKKLENPVKDQKRRELKDRIKDRQLALKFDKE